MYDWNLNEKRLMDSIDIKQHISTYESVQRDSCLCPFHDDHDPSLKISSKKQLAKCFVCGWSGNVVKFHADYHKTNKQKAMVDLSESYGITIDSFNQTSNIDFTFAEVYSKTTPFLHFYLNNFQPALNYMFSRGISKEVIDKFEVGICPKNNTLYKFLYDQYKDESKFISTELFTYNKEPKYGSRIVLPIKDYSNTHTVGFVGRLVKYDTNKKYFSNDDTSNKYINPMESSHLGGYHKDQYLYGYYFAKNYQDIYVVEGYMDVLAMHTAGYENTVALGGTAMTSKQFSLISNKNIILALDSDKSGITAALKFTKEYAYKPFRYVIFRHKDANDSLIEGKILMKELNLHDFIKFILVSKVFDTDDLDKRIKFYNYIISIADALHDDVMMLSIKKLLLQHFGLNENISDFVNEALKKLGGI
jgi:DNA primase